MLAERRVRENKINNGQLYELLLSDGFEKFEFYVGELTGPNHRVLLQPMLDGSCLVQYAGAEYGRMPEFDESILDEDEDAARYGRMIFLDRPAWRRLAKLLDSCDIMRWDHRYIQGENPGGKQWYLDIACRGRRSICRAGYNAYPPPWDRLMRILQREVDARIK